MANNYNDVFGNHTLPPSEYGYRLLTIVADTTLVWPYNSDGGIATVAKVMDVICAAGNVLTLPDATQVSVGEDLLIRNIGANALTIKDAAGIQVATVAIGAASYFYLTDNSTVAGVFGVIGFGIGTSTVDAASLVGYGIKAIGASLNQSHPVVPFASGVTLDETYRAKLVVFTGGAGTFSLTAAATLGNDYFVMFRNEGTGTVTIDPASAETVDGQATLQVQPGESLMLICTGTQWYSVGYGRSMLYQFTQLTKDVSAGGTITLTAAEASNKLLTFIGNPTGTVTVVVPAVVAVYYTYSNISTTQSIVVKTAAGFGAVIEQGTRIIMICDGTNVLSAQSAVANASVSLTDGSAAIPSLFFASQTNTGMFKRGTADLGFTVAGVQQGYFGAAGLVIATVGANDTQRHTLPAVASDTVALLAAAQTFTNKTISGAANTLTNIPNASLVNSAIAVNGSVVALGGSITIDAATPYPLTIGTGLSGTSFNGSAPVTVAISMVPIANGGTNAATGPLALVNLGERTGATASLVLPAGTTAQRDVSPQFGYARANSTLGHAEWWNGTAWVAFADSGAFLQTDGSNQMTAPLTFDNSTSSVIKIASAPVVNITSTAGIPFMKNKLINGEVTRINQRGVANWAAVANGDYGYDRWKKIDASNMTQIIEVGNFRPNTVHTLSGIGVTTQQITSPASGNWTLPNIPIAATNVQVEEGLEATPFEVRHIGFEMNLCEWYFKPLPRTSSIGWVGAGGSGSTWRWPLSWSTMRVQPTVVGATFTLAGGTGGVAVATSPSSGYFGLNSNVNSGSTSIIITAGFLDAEIP